MSEWINANIAKPPESHSVLLYIVDFFDENICENNISDENIFVGFYGCDDYEREGFYIDYLDEEMTPTYKFIEENEKFKVIAWTLLARRPYREILKKEWSA